MLKERNNSLILQQNQLYNEESNTTPLNAQFSKLLSTIYLESRFKSIFWCRSISRVVFYTLMKPYINEKGEKEMDIISPSTALQIAGRAGRFASQFVEGTVTTFKGEDLAILKKLLKTSIEPIQVKLINKLFQLFSFNHSVIINIVNIVVIFVCSCSIVATNLGSVAHSSFNFNCQLNLWLNLQLNKFCCTIVN